MEKTLGLTGPNADDMLLLTRRDAADKDIAHLCGLEHAKNLTCLCLICHKISYISLLGRLAELSYPYV